MIIFFFLKKKRKYESKSAPFENKEEEKNQHKDNEIANAQNKKEMSKICVFSLFIA